MTKPKKRSLIEIGTKTQWGKVVGITNHGGERYYFCSKKVKHAGLLMMTNPTISLMPADVVEEIGGKKKGE